MAGDFEVGERNEHIGHEQDNKKHPEENSDPQRGYSSLDDCSWLEIGLWNTVVVETHGFTELNQINVILFIASGYTLFPGNVHMRHNLEK